MDEKQVGHGSKPGKRWFVSLYPELSITLKAADIIVSDLGKERAQKAVRILFTKQVKPLRYQGDGMLGSNNHTGTDKNDNAFWGVFAIDDPGEGEPKTDKERKAKEVLAFLRDHEYYRTTVQDNKAESKAKLKELDWDPRILETGSGNGVLARGREKIENPGVAAPEDTRSAKPAGRVADMIGRR